MNVNIPYGSVGINFYIPDEKIWQVLFPYLEKPIEDLKSTIYKGLIDPTGTPPLKDIVSSYGDPKTLKISIICSVIEHYIPYKDILDVLIPYLQELGVLLPNVRIIVANGCRVPLNRREIFDLFGRWISPILTENHNCKENLIKVVKSSSWGEISLNKYVAESQLKIGISTVLPNPIYGFTGGSFVVTPGISGIDTINTYYKLSLVGPPILPGQKINMLRTMSDYAAESLKLDFTINITQNVVGGICGVFCGAYDKAFKKAADESTRLLGVRIRPGADLVIAGSYPADCDLWQLFMAFLLVSRSVRKGGYLIFISPCYEGTAKVNPILLGLIAQKPEALRKAIRRSKVSHIPSAVLALKVAEELNRIKLCLISDGISPKDANLMKISLFKNFDEAYKYCIGNLENNEVKISIIPYGGIILPYFEEEHKYKTGKTTRWL